MKKIAMILALIMALSMFAACGSNPTSTPASESSSSAESALPETLEGVMDALYAGLAEEDMPVLPSAEDLKLTNPNNTGKYLELAADLDDETSTYYVGVPRASYVEGIVSEPMMMGVAHKVSVLRAADAEAATALAAEVEANADPRWNICTEAETVYVAAIDDVVVFIMSSGNTATTMVANAEALKA